MKELNRDPDPSLDRLLADTLKARAVSAPGDSCLDAETLAEWADDGLSVRERAAVETHAADCARCQALLAAMVKTAPAARAAAASWRIPALTWLIPAAAVAAALVVWVVVPGRGSIQQTEGPVSSIAEVATAPASAAKSSSSPEIEAKSRGRVVAPAGAAEITTQPSTATEAPKDALAKDKESSALDKMTASTNATARSDAAASSVNGPGAAPQAAPRVPASPPPSVLAERNFAAARLGAPETLIVSTNPSSRWRIVPGGNVQRSADGGSTWQLQQTGATVTLAAGASPSPSVCWLVGPDGIVLLSTDDRSWRRIPFPEATPLVSVSAGDDRTATVTTVDGRKFGTTDGGLTWERIGAI